MRLHNHPTSFVTIFLPILFVCFFSFLKHHVNCVSHDFPLVNFLTCFFMFLLFVWLALIMLQTFVNFFY